MEPDLKDGNLSQVTKGKKFYEQVVEQINSLIARGVYQRGDLLPSEKELIEMTGVSRITVREALRILANAGVIETRRGKGSFVKIDPAELVGDTAAQQKRREFRDEFMQSSRARLVMEPAIAMEVAKTATEEQIALLEKALAAGHAHHPKTETEMSSFHACIVELYGNPLVTAFFESLVQLEERNQLLTAPLQPEFQKETLANLKMQHQQIFCAIKEHNPEFAYFYMKDHCTYLIKQYEEYFNLFY